MVTTPRGTFGGIVDPLDDWFEEATTFGLDPSVTSASWPVVDDGEVVDDAYICAAQEKLDCFGLLPILTGEVSLRGLEDDIYRLLQAIASHPDVPDGPRETAERFLQRWS